MHKSIPPPQTHSRRRGASECLTRPPPQFLTSLLLCSPPGSGCLALRAWSSPRPRNIDFVPTPLAFCVLILAPCFLAHIQIPCYATAAWVRAPTDNFLAMGLIILYAWHTRNVYKLTCTRNLSTFFSRTRLLHRNNRPDYHDHWNLLSVGCAGMEN